jgi:hypothetical protein
MLPFVFMRWMKNCRSASVFFLSFDNQKNPLHLHSVVAQKREKRALMTFSFA